MLNTSNPPNVTAPHTPFPAGLLPTPRTAGVALVALFMLGAVGAQAQTMAPPSPAPIAALRPALANVQTAIGSLGIAHWKASSDVRANAQQDVVSMQRDLNTTLPGLMAQAEAASATGPGILSPTFAVFRNLDALYDVLLRVTETAALTGTSSDANILEQARAGLESSRSQLGVWLMQAIGAQEAQAAHPAPPVSHATAPSAPNKVVVEDGPEVPKPRKKKSVPATAPQ